MRQPFLVSKLEKKFDMTQKKGFFGDIADSLNKEHWRAFGKEFTDSFRDGKWRKEILSYLLVIAGSLLFAVGDVMFANPYRLAPGGTYGISNVLNSVFPWKISLYAACMDIPLLLIGTLILGPRFGVKTILSTFVILGGVLAIESLWGYDPVIHNGILNKDAMASIPETIRGLIVYPVEDTHLPLYFIPDYFLNTLVAGLIYGVAIGVIFRAGATSGGSDIISMILNKYTKISLGTLVIIVDTCITLSTLIAFGELRLPFYSIMVIVIEGWIIDRIMALNFKKKKTEEAQAA